MALHRQITPTKSMLTNGLQNVTKTIGTLKGLYDIGKIVYSGYQTIRPLISAATLLI